MPHWRRRWWRRGHSVGSSGTRLPCSSRNALELAADVVLDKARGLRVLAAVQVRRDTISPRVTGVYIFDVVCSNHILASTSSAPRSSWAGKTRRFPSSLRSS